MEGEESVDALSTDSPVKSRKKSGCLIALLALLLLTAAIWLLVRPGVFTIQPIGALPEGRTVIYHSRGPQIPLFSSPDGMCLDLQDSVTLMCRMAALSAVEEIADRIIVRLPYSEFAYLISTSGTTFDQ